MTREDRETTGSYGINARSPHSKKTISCYYAKEEDYYKTLTSFSSVTKEFFNHDNPSIYFMFPHVQDFIDEDYISKDVFNLAIHPELIEFKEKNPVIPDSNNGYDNIVKTIWPDGSYGINISNNLDTYNFVLNERFVLGNQLKGPIEINDGHEEISHSTFVGTSESITSFTKEKSPILESQDDDSLISKSNTSELSSENKHKDDQLMYYYLFQLGRQTNYS